MERPLLTLNAGGTLRLRVLLVLDVQLFASDARRVDATQFFLARPKALRLRHGTLRARYSYERPA